MLLSEQFEDDKLGKLLIEEKSKKMKHNDIKNLLDIISGKEDKFISKIYENVSITKIGKNILSFDFPESMYEMADVIIELCDNFNYKIKGSVTNNNINIRIIKN